MKFRKENLGFVIVFKRQNLINVENDEINFKDDEIKTNNFKDNTWRIIEEINKNGDW